MQKDVKLSDEASRYWGAISDEGGRYEFDRRQKKIAALELVTREQVQQCFERLVFTDGRRLNIKLYSHAHWAEDRSLPSQANDAFYRDHCNTPEGAHLIKNPKTFTMSQMMFPRL
jgi:secreted Zn-dependent insulinase-like peptidase